MLFGGGGAKFKFEKGGGEDIGDTAMRYGLGNWLGADYKGMGTGKWKDKPVYDYSKTFQPITKTAANSEYDYSPINSAMESYKKPSLFKETYNPYQFNFADQGKLNEYVANQYNLGAADIRREGKGNLTQLQQSIGTRRPGLLMKAGAQSSRDVGEQLAKMNMALRGEALNRGIDLNRDQQQSQAGENLRGYQSRADLERANADEMFRSAQALESAGQNKIKTEAQITQTEKENQAKKLEDLMNYYLTLIQSRRAAQSKNDTGRGGVLGKIAGAAGSAARAFGG